MAADIEKYIGQDTNANEALFLDLRK